MSKTPPRICESCSDRYLPFQLPSQSSPRQAICDSCNLWSLTEPVSYRKEVGSFVHPPFLRDFEKILNELETAYVQAASDQNFDLAEDIALMIDKFEFEQYQSEKVSDD